MTVSPGYQGCPRFFFHSGVGSNPEQALLRLPFGDGIRAARARRIALAERSACRFFTVDLDRAHVNETAHAGQRGHRRQTQRAMGVDTTVFRQGIRRPFIHDMHARGEMHNRLDIIQRRFPVRRGPDIADNVRPDLLVNISGAGVDILSQCRAHRVTFLQQGGDHCASDIPGGSGDQHRLPAGSADAPRYVLCHTTRLT